MLSLWTTNQLYWYSAINKAYLVITPSGYHIPNHKLKDIAAGFSLSRHDSWDDFRDILRRRSIFTSPISSVDKASISPFNLWELSPFHTLAIQETWQEDVLVASLRSDLLAWPALRDILQLLYKSKSVT